MDLWHFLSDTIALYNLSSNFMRS